MVNNHVATVCKHNLTVLHMTKMDIIPRGRRVSAALHRQDQ